MPVTFLWPCQGNWVRVLVTDEMPWALLCNEIVTQALVLKDLTVLTVFCEPPSRISVYPMVSGPSYLVSSARDDIGPED